jgi:hypothetical protein
MSHNGQWRASKRSLKRRERIPWIGGTIAERPPMSAAYMEQLTAQLSVVALLDLDTARRHVAAVGIDPVERRPQPYKGPNELRSGARLLANELLGRAVQIARRIAGGVHGTSRRAHDHAGVLTVHDLRVTSDQARRGCLRRYQGSRSQRDWLEQPWGITHNQNA